MYDVCTMYVCMYECVNKELFMHVYVRIKSIHVSAHFTSSKYVVRMYVLYMKMKMNMYVCM